MPVAVLPPPTWPTTFSLGFISAVFDHYSADALALQQGGYDWALLAHAVGFDGLMVWFGSSQPALRSRISFPKRNRNCVASRGLVGPRPPM
jgi:hypothetical protein